MRRAAATVTKTKYQSRHTNVVKFEIVDLHFFLIGDGFEHPRICDFKFLNSCCYFKLSLVFFSSFLSQPTVQIYICFNILHGEVACINIFRLCYFFTRFKNIVAMLPVRNWNVVSGNWLLDWWKCITDTFSMERMNYKEVFKIECSLEVFAYLWNSVFNLVFDDADCKVIETSTITFQFATMNFFIVRKQGVSNSTSTML